MTRKLLLTIPLTALAVAAAFGTTPDAALADDSQPLIEGRADDHERPPPPPSCESDADCEDACPDGSQGCSCEDTPHGKGCVPTCSEDDDCPDVGEMELRCHEGICKPPPPPRR